MRPVAWLRFITHSRFVKREQSSDSRQQHVVQYNYGRLNMISKVGVISSRRVGSEKKHALCLTSHGVNLMFSASHLLCFTVSVFLLLKTQ